MGKKHPLVYLDALIANKYEFFYPNTPLDYSCSSYALSWHVIDVTNYQILSDFSCPVFQKNMQEKYDYIRDKVFSYSPMKLLNSSEVITWCLLIWVIKLDYEKRKTAKQLTLIPLLIMIICLGISLNGSYARYQYPIFLMLPWLMTAGLFIDEQ